MGYEVDFLAVGEKSKSGDAIVIRFGNLYGLRSEQTIVVIDGGYKEDGQKLVDHIERFYDTSIVDLVILTHPDSDHVSGLHTVLEELTVKKLWMHKPWEHNEGMAEKFKDGRITDNSVGEKLKESLQSAYDLQKLAEEKKIPIEEPFEGVSDDSGHVLVLGPTEEYFEELIPEFSGMPETKAEVEKSAMQKFAEAVRSFISAFWNKDLIVDVGEETSAQNSSSAIIHINVDNRRLLLTGDAGREALTHAADYLDKQVYFDDLTFIQIPHHGSFRNIGPTVLNRLAGEIVSKGSTPDFSAFASVAKEGAPKHPSKKVLNAFTRRGARVHVTAGVGKHHFYKAPDREGWSTAEAEKFHEEVEED